MPIEHVFVLMLENRSFDHMLGFSGLKGTDAVTGKPTKINGVPPAPRIPGKAPTIPPLRLPWIPWSPTRATNSKTFSNNSAATVQFIPKAAPTRLSTIPALPPISVRISLAFSIQLTSPT